MKKTPYTAETFPLWAAWIRRIGSKARHSIVSVDSNISTEQNEISFSVDNEYYEIAGTDGVWKPFYKEEDVCKECGGNASSLQSVMKCEDGDRNKFCSHKCADKKPWYENIPPEGIACYVWDDNFEYKYIANVMNYKPDKVLQFHTEYESFYNAEPCEKITVEDLKI